MSKRRDRDYLVDITDSMERIAVYPRGLTYNRFIRDRKTQDEEVEHLPQTPSRCTDLTLNPFPIREGTHSKDFTPLPSL